MIKIFHQDREVKIGDSVYYLSFSYSENIEQRIHVTCSKIININIITDIMKEDFNERYKVFITLNDDYSLYLEDIYYDEISLVNDYLNKQIVSIDTYIQRFNNVANMLNIESKYKDIVLAV